MRYRNWLKSAAAAGALTALAGMAFAEGTLRYATVGEPPSLDQHVLTSDLATTIAHHIFEGLYTFNAANAPVGLLAAGDVRLKRAAVPLTERLAELARKKRAAAASSSSSACMGRLMCGRK